jgi:hypothetical protein
MPFRLIGAESAEAAAECEKSRMTRTRRVFGPAFKAEVALVDVRCYRMSAVGRRIKLANGPVTARNKLLPGSTHRTRALAVVSRTWGETATTFRGCSSRRGRGHSRRGPWRSLRGWDRRPNHEG